MRTQEGPWQPITGSHHQITTGTATGITRNTDALKKATMAHITVEVAAVRWRDDGTAPTADTGHVLASGATLEYTGDLGAIKFINDVAASGAVVNISLYR